VEERKAHNKPRPRYLDLLRIRLPLPGVLSILHRVSGLVLLIALPFLLAALQCSLASEEGYAETARVLGHPFSKLILWGLAWAFFHHLCAGIRHLLLDIHIGIELAAARASAMAAFIVSLLMTLIFGAWLWL
jgi:succinate dehydrogenase / fumarate reductase cytochrome b subunit